MKVSECCCVVLCIENEGICPSCNRPKKKLWYHMKKCYAKMKDKAAKEPDDQQSESESDSECEDGDGKQPILEQGIEEEKDVPESLLQVKVPQGGVASHKLVGREVDDENDPGNGIDEVREQPAQI